MHVQAVALCQLHGLVVADPVLVGVEQLVLGVPVGFLHVRLYIGQARPALGVDDVRTVEGSAHVVGLLEGAAITSDVVADMSDLLGVELEALRTRKHQIRAVEGTGLHEAVRNRDRLLATR